MWAEGRAETGLDEAERATQRMTPAMKAGIARKPWSVRDLLTA